MLISLAEYLNDAISLYTTTQPQTALKNSGRWEVRVNGQEFIAPNRRKHFTSEWGALKRVCEVLGDMFAEVVQASIANGDSIHVISERDKFVWNLNFVAPRGTAEFDCTHKALAQYGAAAVARLFGGKDSVIDIVYVD